MPLIGRSPAVASLANLQIKAQNYIQLVLNPDKAIAEYVANFLNTVLGQKIRESLLSGTSILKISKSQLVNADFYLPNVEIQSEIIGIKSEITNLSTQLETLERQLWERPQKYKETQKAVSLLNHVDNFDAWVESLPFPLASILWQYHANNDVKEKVDYLLNFFEALSQFIAVIMLSAYAANENLYIEESPNWVEPQKSPYRDWILKPIFGNWIILCRKLAKVTRKLQQDKDKKENFLELFGKPNHEFLGMLTDKNLFNELDVASTYRNLWKGHGGAANEKQYQMRFKLLESSLSKVRQVIRDKWETALLLLPVVNHYKDGIFNYQVQALMGTKTPFKKVKEQTLVPMEDGKIYLLHTNQQRPVKLLPFIRLIGSPESEPNACYFYNGQKNKENEENEENEEQVRWVTYHFGSKPDEYSPFAEIKPAIDLIYPTADNTEESSA